MFSSWSMLVFLPSWGRDTPCEVSPLGTRSVRQYCSGQWDRPGVGTGWWEVCQSCSRTSGSDQHIWYHARQNVLRQGIKFQRNWGYVPPTHLRLCDPSSRYLPTSEQRKTRSSPARRVMSSVTSLSLWKATSLEAGPGGEKRQGMLYPAAVISSKVLPPGEQGEKVPSQTPDSHLSQQNQIKSLKFANIQWWF